MFPVAAVCEPKTIRLGDRDIPYLLKRSQQRRSIVLSVDERGLMVSAPWRSTERRITGIIHDAEDWVLRKLAHLVEMNHSRRFWNLVAAVCPHHEQARAELDHMGRYYMDI